MDDEIARYERMATWRNFEAPLAAIPIPEGSRVLDVGCGSGFVTRLIARSKESARVVGLDREPAYVQAARRIADAEGVTCADFVAGDAREPPFASGTFDLVWAAFVVEYLAASVVDVLQELARVVRPGGIVAVFDVDGFLLRHDPIDKDLAARLEHWRKTAVARGFDPEIGHQLPAAFAAAGLRDVQSRTFPDPELYPKGRPSDEILAVWRQRLAGMRALRTVFGSESEAERFRRDVLALLERPDRRTSGANWLVWGTVLTQL